MIVPPPLHFTKRTILTCLFTALVLLFFACNRNPLPPAAELVEPTPVPLPLQTQSLLFPDWTLSDNVDVEVIGVGLGNRYGLKGDGTLTRTLAIPDAGNVQALYAQVVFKHGGTYLAPNNVTISSTNETKSYSAGELTLSLPTDPNGTALSNVGQMYEGIFAPADSLTVDIDGIGNNNLLTPRAFIVYVLRPAATPADASVGGVPNFYVYGQHGYESVSQTLTIPSNTTTRDVTVTFSVSELGAVRNTAGDPDTRNVELSAQAGGVSTSAIYEFPNFQDELLIATLTLSDVPATTTEVTATVTSPDLLPGMSTYEAGDSVYWNGVDVAVENNDDGNSAPNLPPSSDLPAGWLRTDITDNPTSFQSSSSYDDTTDTFTLASAIFPETNPTGEALENLHYVYQSVATDATLTARLENASQAAGLMIRASNDATAPFVFAGVSNGQLEVRQGGGTTTTLLTSSPVTEPIWVRLVKEEDSVEVFQSDDNINFSLVTTVAMTLANPFNMGMVSGTTGEVGQVNLAEVYLQDNSISPDFEITLSSGIPPLTVFFDASSTTIAGGNAQDLSYTWTFADGSTAEGIDVTKTFNRAGETDVLLTVSNGSVQAQVQKTITVQTPENEDGTLTLLPGRSSVINGDGIGVFSFDALDESIESVDITIEEGTPPEDVLDSPDLGYEQIEILTPIYAISSSEAVYARGSGGTFGLAITVPEGVDPSEVAIAYVADGELSLPPSPDNFWDIAIGQYIEDQSVYVISISLIEPVPFYITLIRADGGFVSNQENFREETGVATQQVATPVFAARCNPIAYPDLCSDEDGIDRIEAAFQQAYLKFKDLGFNEPRLLSRFGWRGVPVPPGLNEIYYFDLVNARARNCSSGDRRALGVYRPDLQRIFVCISDTFSIQDAANGSVSDHELFHAIQFSYLVPSRSTPPQRWFLEGQATLAELSDETLRRDPSWNNFFILSEFFSNARSKPTPYRLQDFWGYIGAREGRGLDFLLTFLNGAGATPAQVDQTLSASPMLGKTSLKDLYWQFIKDISYEHDVGGFFSIDALDCTFNPRSSSLALWPLFDPANPILFGFQSGADFSSRSPFTATATELIFRPSSRLPNYSAVVDLAADSPNLRYKFYDQRYKGQSSCKDNASDNQAYLFNVGLTEDEIINVLDSNVSYEDTLETSIYLYFASVDIDDGSPDGNQFALIGTLDSTGSPDDLDGVADGLSEENPLVYMEIDFVNQDVDGNTLIGNSATPDGSQVDMADFRRFRDWLVEAEGKADFNGSANHPKKNLNSADYAFWGDYNGDGQVSSTTFHPVSWLPLENIANPEAGPIIPLLTDFEVFKQIVSDGNFWQDDHYTLDELDGLLSSGDVEIWPRLCFELDRLFPGVPIRTEIGGKTFEHTPGGRSSESHIFTLPEGSYEAVLTYTVRDDQNQRKPLEVTKDFTVTPGSDAIWDPICPYVEFTIIDPRTGQETQITDANDGSVFGETVPDGEVRAPQLAADVRITVEGAGLRPEDVTFTGIVSGNVRQEDDLIIYEESATDLTPGTYNLAAEISPSLETLQLSVDESLDSEARSRMARQASANSSGTFTRGFELVEREVSSSLFAEGESIINRSPTVGVQSITYRCLRNSSGWRYIDKTNIRPDVDIIRQAKAEVGSSDYPLSSPVITRVLNWGPGFAQRPATEISGNLWHFQINVANLIGREYSYPVTSQVTFDNGYRYTTTGRFNIALDEGSVPRCVNDDDDGDTSGNFGDPHLSTPDRRVYTFHAVGDYVLTRSTDPADNFEVQVRYVPFRASATDWSGENALAMMVETDKVEIYALTNGGVDVLINESPVVLNVGGLIHLDGGGHVSRDSQEVIVTWPGRNPSQVRAAVGSPDLQKNIRGWTVVYFPSYRQNETEGLLGVYNRDPNDDLRLRDGTIINPATPADLYTSGFRESWSIAEGASDILFSRGTDPYDPTFPQDLINSDSFTQASIDNAFQICTDAGIVQASILNACAADVLITGNPDWADIAARFDANSDVFFVNPSVLVLTPNESADLGVVALGSGSSNFTWAANNGQGQLNVNIDNSTAVYTAPPTPGEYLITVTADSDNGSVTQEVYVTVVEALTLQDPLAAGNRHSLFINSSDTTVYGWGANYRGQLGDTATEVEFTPHQITKSGGRTFDGVIAISTSESVDEYPYPGTPFMPMELHTLALTSDRTVWAWGENNSGQLGNGLIVETREGVDYTLHPEPVVINENNDSLTNIVEIAAGDGFSLALNDTGEVFLWGEIYSGVPATAYPTRVAGLPSNIQSIAVGAEHALALDSQQQVWAWGRNDSGMLGHGTWFENQPIPARVKALDASGNVVDLTNVVAIFAGQSASAAIKGDGSVWMWGYVGTAVTNPSELDFGSALVAQQIVLNEQKDSLLDAKEVAFGDYHRLVLTNSGEIWAWGENYTMQLGDGTSSYQAYPVKVRDAQGDLTNIDYIDAGSEHSIAMARDGTIYTWGRNCEGQLSDAGYILNTMSFCD